MRYAFFEFNFEQHAYDEIIDTAGNLDLVVKPKSLLKFGQNDSVGTSEVTVMQLQGSETGETYVSTNAIDRIVSSNDSNDQVMTIEGHTVDGSGDFTFVTQTATLDGQTAVTLATPLARVSRLYNSDTTVLASSSVIYVYENSAISNGVPDDDSKVHIVANAGDEQSLKGATTFSSADYGIITQLVFGVNKRNAAVADIKLKVREKGGVFRSRFLASCATTGSNNFVYAPRPYIIIPPNADVLFTASASASNVSIIAEFNAFIVTIRS